MNTVILFYSENDASAADLRKLLFNRLDGRCLLAAVSRPIITNFPSGIAVFCSTPEELLDQKIPAGTVAVCDPADRHALQILAKNKIPAVTAGMSGFDTVTLSSVSETSATVGVLRTVTSLSGEKTEPCEFTVNLTKPLSCRTISIFCAVMLLLGEPPDTL